MSTITTLQANTNGSDSRTIINTNFDNLNNDAVTSLALKADLDSPTFTGSPSLPTGTTAVTQSANDNSTKLATTAYVDTSISALVLPEAQLRVATVTLSSADILALHNTPITLLAAPGAGKINVIDEVIFSFTAGTQYANGNDLRIKYSTADNHNDFSLCETIGNAIIVSASSSINKYAITSSGYNKVTLTQGTNDSIHILGNNGTAFITGTGTAKVFIKYRIITL